MNEQEQQKLLAEIKRLEGIYLGPQNFDQYKNYWLPDYIVKESTNVLSLGVHRDVGFEQAMLKDNPNLNIHPLIFLFLLIIVVHSFYFPICFKGNIVYLYPPSLGSYCLTLLHTVPFIRSVKYITKVMPKWYRIY